MITPSWQTGKNRVNAGLINPGDLIITKEYSSSEAEWTSEVVEVNVQSQSLKAKVLTVGDSADHSAIGRQMSLYALDVYVHQPQ